MAVAARGKMPAGIRRPGLAKGEDAGGYLEARSCQGAGISGFSCAEFLMPDPTYVRNAFARIADRYVLTNHVLSMGMDFWWRHAVTKRIKLLRPQTLLDVASGTGDLALKIQDEIPGCEVVATDFCPEMLEHATSRGVRKTLVADALALPFPDDGFDVVTVAFGLRNMADYPDALREMRRVLKPGGSLLAIIGLIFSSSLL